MIEDAPTPSQRVRSREEVADYLLDIGATLASYGCPSYRLEDMMRLVADVEGFHAEPFALPTGLFLRVVPKDTEGPFPEVHRMARLSERGVDLDRLTLVDEIFKPDTSASGSNSSEVRLVAWRLAEVIDAHRLAVAVDRALSGGPAR